MKTDTHFWSYLAQFLLEWKIFQTKVAEKIKTHIFAFNNGLWDYVEEFFRVEQATDGNMADAICMLDT